MEVLKEATEKAAATGKQSAFAAIKVRSIDINCIFISFGLKW